jgi:methyl-accepting chemotaxis protein
MENLVPIFVAVTAAAVTLQALILVALYFAVRKATAKLEAEVDELKVKALPVLASADVMLVELRPKVHQIADNLLHLHPKIGHIMDTLVELRPKIQSVADTLVELRPKVQTISDNLLETTTTVRSELQRVDATVNDAVDRARLQVIRADEMLTRTFDRVEHTTDVVTKTVVSPVKQVSGIVRGVTAGVEFFLGNRGRKNGDNRSPRRPVPQDEMFI